MTAVDPYARLARIYDRIMAGVDYEAWADYVEAIFRRFRRRPRKLLDLACGTGSSALPFARRGYRVAGVDLSAAMLEEARIKASREGLPLSFYRADLRTLKLEEKFQAALLFQDGLNYLTEEEDLRAALAAVRAVLEPGGLFIFDLCRPGQRTAGPGSPFWAEEEEFTLVGETRYSPRTGLWEVELVVFARRENGLYEKFIEHHRERDYSPERMRVFLEEAGFRCRECFPTFRLEPASGGEAKITFVAENPP
ncbi:MAG TPA: class I SAM-dependent methyltransferase [Bacillota bacterium]|jgi:SAM-dependent methyltransferase|nr:class I SAM-dependent methyltransferase [Bacillota bacterium]HOB86567.1 class I SAM-dependent methyltransferase [Bacillota bacterium]HOP68424.1 class I SAM-dependent methyltransferase [Bacillota bacterium]HPT33530.1 class I SAM-dependent methyltransferase [Bacillota bacterium]HPZ65602.1 class I SAM-dependent methyltransferase [Bacillota bacterium]